MFISIT